MKTSNQFCQEILNLSVSNRVALSNLVMSLASYVQAHSVIEFSESPLYQYEYSSLHKSIQHLSKGNKDYAEVSKKIQQFCLSSLPLSNVYTFATDVTSIIKAHSPCLQDRQYVKINNNRIRSNQPIDIGYNYSFINVGADQSSEYVLDAVDTACKKWSLPVCINRVPLNQTNTQVAITQLNNLLSHPAFSEADLIINTLDSAYGTAAYLSAVHHHDHLVNVVRFRSSCKVYPYQPRMGTGGANQIYGPELFLVEKSGHHPYTYKGEQKEKYRHSVLEWPVDEHLCFQTTTKKGKLLKVSIRRFNNMMIRSKKGHNMKDKPFDLLHIRLFDATTNQAIYKNAMWLAITGKEKQEITTYNGYQKYRHRYDIEPFFRFAKQKLFMDKYQSPNVKNLDNWMLLIQMAAWLLWIAKEEVNQNPKKWQKYLPAYKEKPKQIKKQLSISQTRKAAQSLFLTFDQKRFAPQKAKKGKGRKEGTKLKKRNRYKPVKKSNFKTIVEKLE